MSFIGPKEHGTAQKLRAMPIGTQEEAALFVSTYRAWVDAISTFGCGVFLKNKKPACVTHGDIFLKAVHAHEAAGLCYWQVPHDHPRNKAAGIPLAAWQRARTSRGLPI